MRKGTTAFDRRQRWSKELMRYTMSWLATAIAADSRSFLQSSSGEFEGIYARGSEVPN